MSDHVLHLGDCLDPLRGLATLADKSVDHVICDPPYEAEAHTLQRRTPKGPGHGRSVPEAKVIAFPAIDERIRLESAEQMARIARRWILVFCQAESVGLWREALEAGGASYRRAAIWIKPDAQPQLTGDRPAQGYESIVCAHGLGRSVWNGGGKPGRYFVNRCHPGSRPNTHPTEKPIDLIRALVNDFTDPGEVVCDPFAGSATTGVACKQLARRFIGWELNGEYHERAVRRLENTKQQYELLPRGPKPKQTRLLP